MMSKVLMGAGSWSIELLSTTPNRIRRRFPRKDESGFDNWWTHVAFTEVDRLSFDPKDPSSLGSIFTGPVWSRGSKMTRFSGPHLTGWMSNQRGDAAPGSYGTEYPTGWLATPKTITQIVQAWFPLTGVTNGITYGSAFSAPSTTIPGRDINTYLPPTKRPLDEMMAQVGCEYRVTDLAALDWGVAGSLFSGLTSPTVLCAEDVRTSAGSIRALDATISVEEDITGLRNTATVVASDASSYYSGGWAATGEPNVFDFNTGTAVFGAGPIRADTTDFTSITDLHHAAATEFSFTNRRITVSCSDYCLMADLEAGDGVYCWSPDDFVADPTTSIDVAGRTINPEILRVTQIDQPFQEGMGAYVIQWAGPGDYTIERITDYVKRENQPTRLTLGSRPEPPTTSRDKKSVIR